MPGSAPASGSRGALASRSSPPAARSTRATSASRAAVLPAKRSRWKGYDGSETQRPPSGEEAAPAHRIAAGVERAERLEEHRHLVLFAPQRGRRDPRLARGAAHLVDGGEEDGVRAELDERGVPVPHEDLHRGREEHRLAEVARPVVGAEVRPFGDGAGDGRVDRRRGAPGREAGEGVEQRGAQRVHLRAVRGDVDLDPAAEDRARLQGLDDRVERRRVAREHRGARAVAHGDRDLILVAADGLLGLLPGELDHDHGAAAPRLQQERAPPADDARGVVQRERARDVRRRDLAHAVPHDRVRLHAPAAEDRGQGHLDREQQRLDDVDPIELRRAVGAGQRGQRRPAHVAAEGGVAALDRGPERRVTRQQPAPHPEPLRALAGNTKTSPGRPSEGAVPAWVVGWGAPRR